MPRNVQIMKATLAKGEHEIELHASQGKTEKVKVNIKENQNVILYVVGTKKQLFTQLL